MKNIKLIHNNLVHMDTMFIIMILIVMYNVLMEHLQNIFYKKIDILIFALIVLNKIALIV